MSGRQSRSNEPPQSFNDGRSTENASRKAAFNNAKDANGIARSQSPRSVTHVQEVRLGSPTGRTMRQYDFWNQYGKPISIRQDPAMRYPDGGKQPPHYNAGPADGKLSQHHYFPETQKPK